MNMTRSITGTHVLWGFIAFFALIFAANAVLVFLALDSWTGLETEQSYSKGLAYNRVLDADARQQATGWQGEVAVERLPDGRARIRVALSDKQGAALDGLIVKADFVRPTHQGYDFSGELRPTGSGIYAMDIAPPLPGQWNVRIAARRGEHSHVFQKRVVLR